MNIKAWIDKNAQSLVGKTVAITGSTGGLGREICKHLVSLGANLILLDRNEKASSSHRLSLIAQNPKVSVKCLRVDLEDMDSVINATEVLKTIVFDVFISNAGAYSITRHVCITGYENVFQINFISPYYMIRELLPQLHERNGRVIVVGSIAHNYSNADKNDVDFRTRKASSFVYGNAKRYLMFSLSELFKSEKNIQLAIVHPGITPTNITAHYPKLIYAIIKYPMKIVFMKPKKAALSVIAGLFDNCTSDEWIGPRFFNIWGFPKKCILKSCGDEEKAYIASTAEKIYKSLKNNQSTRSVDI